MLHPQELKQIIVALDCASKKGSGKGRKPNIENQMVTLGTVKQLLSSYTLEHDNFRRFTLGDLEKMLGPDNDDDDDGLLPFPKNPA